MQGLDGAFVKVGEKYFQLVESYDDNGFQEGSAAKGRKLEAFIKSEGLGAESADELRAQYKADRELLKQSRSANSSSDGYYPAGGLPEDSVLVVRTSALAELLAASSEPERTKADLGSRERDTLLKLVIGMAIEAYRFSPDATRSNTAAEVASDLDKNGMSVSDDTVRKWLKEAAQTVLPKKPK